MHPPFEKWPSIQRLSSEICWITEKIDGRSTSGSRSRDLR